MNVLRIHQMDATYKTHRLKQLKISLNLTTIGIGLHIATYTFINMDYEPIQDDIQAVAAAEEELYLLAAAAVVAIHKEESDDSKRKREEDPRVSGCTSGSKTDQGMAGTKVC